MASSAGCGSHPSIYLKLEAKQGAQRIRRISLTDDWGVGDDWGAGSPTSSRLTFRAGDLGKGEILAGLEFLTRDAAGTGSYSSTGVTIYPAGGQAGGGHAGGGKDQAVPGDRWRAAPRIKDYRDFWLPVWSPIGTIQADFRRRKLGPDGLMTVSPDGRWFTVTAVGNATDSALSDIYTSSYGGVEVDIYKSATGERVVSLQGSHRGLLTEQDVSGSWVSDRYFVLPADLSRSALLLCDLGGDNPPVYDVDPEHPEFWGIEEMMDTPDAPFHLNREPVIRVTIRSKEAVAEAGWRVNGGNHRSAWVIQGVETFQPPEGLLFAGVQPVYLAGDSNGKPYPALGFGPFVIDQVALFKTNAIGQRTRFPIPSAPFTTQAYSYEQHPFGYVFPASAVARRVTVVPFLSTASVQEYRFIMEDPFQDLPSPEMRVVVNFDATPRGACAFTLKTADRQVILLDDSGSKPAGTLGISEQMPGQGMVQNSQCAISNPKLERDGKLLTLVLRIEPKAGFSGRRNVYVKIDGYTGPEFGWNWRATWGVAARTQ